MKNNILIILFAILFLSSCSSMNEAGKFLRNERINTTDEFLIKKRQPLTEPPDINKIPQPNSLKENDQQSEQNSVKDILIESQQNDDPEKLNSSTEQSILDKIQKK